MRVAVEGGPHFLWDDIKNVPNGRHGIGMHVSFCRPVLLGSGTYSGVHYGLACPQQYQKTHDRAYPLPPALDLTIPNPGNGNKITLHPRDVEFGTTLVRTIEPAYFQAIKTKIGRLYAFGRVDYSDIFGVPHWTRFCYVFDGEGDTLSKWEACPRHNDTDKDNE